MLIKNPKSKPKQYKQIKIDDTKGITKQIRETVGVNPGIKNNNIYKNQHGTNRCTAGHSRNKQTVKDGGEDEDFNSKGVINL